MKFVSQDLRRCSGCGRCEMACSFERTGAYSHSASAVRLARIEELGCDLPVTCIGCLRCVSACPSGALTATCEGAVELDGNLCDACGTCRDTCPVGVLDFTEKPFFCTGCGRCIEACDLHALAFSETPGLAGIPDEGEEVGMDPPTRRSRWAAAHAVKLPWISEEDVRLYEQGAEGRPDEWRDGRRSPRR